MSEADKMFEEIGYKKTNSGIYGDIIYKSTRDLAQIIFCTIDKEVCCTNDEGEAIYFSIQELKAINKKCEEFGWI